MATIFHAVSGKVGKVSWRLFYFAVVLMFLLFPVTAVLGETYVIGSISENTTWSLSKSPYIVVNNIAVEEGATLTINPGVQVKFNNGFSLTVSGTLDASGTELSQILFTSNQSVPIAGDWGSIKFDHNSGGSLSNCVVEYADTGIYMANNTSPQITDCKIHHNNIGVKLWFYSSGSKPESGAVVNNCSLYENTEYNYYVDSYVYEWNKTLDATGNWWGTSDPLKIAEGIYDYVDNNKMAAVDFSSFLDTEGGSPIVVSSAGETYLIGGTYDYNMTLSGTYLVPSYFRVQTNQVNIAPGTIIKFMYNAYFVVGDGGRLEAGDISENPVTFTSGATEHVVGDWDGIKFDHNSGGSLNNCVVEYADTGIYMANNTSPQITDCKIRYNNIGVKLWFYSNGSKPEPGAVVNNCSLYENSEYNYYADSYVYEWNKTLDATSNWWGTSDPLKIAGSIYDYADNYKMAAVDFSSFLDMEGGVPVKTSSASETYLIGGTYDHNITLNGTYLVPSFFRVQANQVSIAPGTTIRFMPEAYFVVGSGGKLEADDPSGNPITFTSGEPEPSAGDWGGIRFEHNSGGSLNNCVVEYADTGIYTANNTSPQITDCKIRHNNIGVKLWFYSSGSKPEPGAVVNNCSLYENSEYNYYVDSYVYEWDKTLDATNNWWGTSDLSEISASIYDYTDNPKMAAVDFSYFLDHDPTTNDKSYLQVTITPQEAADAGAQWSVNGTWYNSDEKTELPAGAYTIEFKNVTDYTVPDSQTVTVTSGQTITITGTYTPVTQQKGYLQITIAPQEAITAGAQWKVNDTWNNSGDSVQLTPGTYTIEFKTISGWNTPANQTVTITADQTATTSGTYTKIPVSQQGSLTVTISPQDAIDSDAQWRVDSGTWQNSGHTETGLSVGNHTIEFKTISGWNKPANQTITINDAQTTTANGIYNKIPSGSGAFLTMDDVTAAPGDNNVPLVISLDNSTNNTTPVSSMQIRIKYDATTGIQPKETANLTSRTQGFSTTVTVTENGTNSEILILLYDMSKKATISSDTGPILELLFDISSNAEPDDNTVLEFTECLLSDASADQIPSECSDTATISIGDSCEPIGDVNNDGGINIFDLQSLTNCILENKDCECSDLNNDSSYNIFDIQILINKIINPSGRRHASKARSGQRSDASNTIVLPDVEFQENETGNFGLNLTNDDTIAAGQIRFIYDSTTGFSITDVSKTSRTDSFDNLIFQADETDPANTEVLVLFYSTSGATLSPGSGDILEFTYETEANASGIMTFALTQALLSDQSAIPLQLEAQPSIELTDAIRILKLLSGINTGKFYIDADVNEDRKTGMQEVVYKLQIVSGLRQ